MSGIKAGRFSAIRKFCLWCVCNQVGELLKCPAKKCPLWKIRTGRPDKRGTFAPEQIGKKCKDCKENITKVYNCEFKDCPLYPYRMDAKGK